MIAEMIAEREVVPLASREEQDNRSSGEENVSNVLKRNFRREPLAVAYLARVRYSECNLILVV
jgi:hypothetical protein